MEGLWGAKSSSKEQKFCYKSMEIWQVNRQKDENIVIYLYKQSFFDIIDIGQVYIEDRNGSKYIKRTT